MTDPAIINEARQSLHDALQNYTTLVYGPQVVTAWSATVETLDANDVRNLLVMTSANMTSWGLMGLMIGGMRVATETLAS